MKFPVKKIVFWVLAVSGAFLLLAAGINFYVIISTSQYIFSDIKDVPARTCVIVPGAKVYGKNTVSFVFRDRIEAGVNLYKNGQCAKVLVSGDHGKPFYDEVNAAKNYIDVMHGLDKDDVFMDHAGFSTYDTMSRAVKVFCVRDAVVTSQNFHINRCVYIARAKGIDAVGYVSPEINRFSGKVKFSWQVREFFARIKTFFLVAFDASPRFLGEEIPVTGSGKATWD